MKPVMQTVTGTSGNCMAACLASVLELPIEAVPNFCDAGPDDTDYWNACRAWLRQFGLGIITMTFTSPAQWRTLRLSGHHIVSGPSPRIDGMHHATVWHKGAMVHDPHPDQTGILAPEDMCMLYLVEPTALAIRGVRVDGPVHSCKNCAHLNKSSCEEPCAGCTVRWRSGVSDRWELASGVPGTYKDVTGGPSNG